MASDAPFIYNPVSSPPVLVTHRILAVLEYSSRLILNAGGMKEAEG